MKHPKSTKLYEIANSYLIKDRLIKFRWFFDDSVEMDNKLLIKSMNHEKITEEEFNFLKEKGCCIIETSSYIEALNFDYDLKDILIELSDEFEIKIIDE